MGKDCDSLVFQPRISRTQKALSHGLLTKDLKYAFSIKMAVGKNIRLGKIKYVRKILIFNEFSKSNFLV